MNPCNMILILRIKLIYYEEYHREKIKQQINIIEKLSKIYKLCYGHAYFQLDSLRNKGKILIEAY